MDYFAVLRALALPLGKVIFSFVFLFLFLHLSGNFLWFISQIANEKVFSRNGN